MRRTAHYEFTIPGALIGAWIAMLGLGDWHAAHPAIPTIGYGPALLIFGGVAMCRETVGSWSRTERRDR
jgi:hypothetical protein